VPEPGTAPLLLLGLAGSIFVATVKKTYAKPTT